MKKIIAILTTALLIATAAKAQIIIMDDESNNLREPVAWPALPGNNDWSNDSYIPIGDGIMLLAALGGAYLVSKRKNKKNE